MREKCCIPIVLKGEWRPNVGISDAKTSGERLCATALCGGAGGGRVIVPGGRVNKPGPCGETATRREFPPTW